MTEHVTADEPYLLVEEVAERLGLPLSVLLSRVEAGDIPARRIENENGVHYSLRLGDLGIEPMSLAGADEPHNGDGGAVFDDSARPTLALTGRRVADEGIPYVDGAEPATPPAGAIGYDWRTVADDREPAQPAPGNPSAWLQSGSGASTAAGAGNADPVGVWDNADETIAVPAADAEFAPPPTAGAEFATTPPATTEFAATAMAGAEFAATPPTTTDFATLPMADAEFAATPPPTPTEFATTPMADAEFAVPPPGPIIARNPGVSVLDPASTPHGDLAAMSLDARELVAGLLDRWERTLEQRIYTEQRQRFQGELTARQNMVKQLQMELHTARAEHAAAQAEKDRFLAEKERELADRERDLAAARRVAEEAEQLRASAAPSRRRRWFR